MRQEGIGRHDAEGATAILRQAPQDSINIRLLLKQVMYEWGGFEQFAKDAYKTFSELPAKSPARERMITNIMRLIATATTPGVGPLPTNVEDMEKDLALEMERIYPSGN